MGKYENQVEFKGNKINTKWIGLVAVIFGVLLLANHSNELLKQLVIAPGSVAELGVPADCRADELEEEGLSLLECELMVSNVQITLVSSPEWFRPLMFLLSVSGVLFAALSISVGFGKYLSIPLSKGCTPLFLNALPTNTGVKDKFNVERLMDS